MIVGALVAWILSKLGVNPQQSVTKTTDKADKRAVKIILLLGALWIFGLLVWLTLNN